ncbi:hypothetical protein BHM03_00053413 [Ensete ventricosum]|nr:hypothetical protein BHM03_00053413 [Ensete ventricosum]
MKRPQAEPSRSPPPGLPRRRMERVEQTIPRPPNIPLSSTQTEIFLQIREKGLLKTPNQMKSQPEDRDRRRYCRFHRDYGHDMEECYNLKNQIEDLILERQVDVIVGGPATSDDSSSARKAYAHAEVQKRPQAWGPGITFESENEYLDHDDALVIIACIANARVRHIMIDTGSSVDILYLDAFQKLRMTNRDHVPMTSTLTGFTRDTITPVGVTTLPMTFDDEPRTKTFMVPFMVVNLPSAVDVLVRLASADTPGDLSVSHNLCRPTVATIEMATMVVLPPEVIFPTLRVENFTTEMSEAGLRDNLDMLEEHWAKAHLKTLQYQRAVARLYNRMIRSRPIGEGDIVLRKAEVSDPGRTHEKLVPRWEGPYHITRLVRDGTYTLSIMEVKTLPRAWHVSNLKKFYA